MSGTSKEAVRAASELRSLVGRLRLRLRELRTAEELAPGALSVLLRLEKDGPTTAAALAAVERVRPQPMGRRLAELEAQGLIVRNPDPTDGRRLVVELSDVGRARVDGDRAARREWLARALQERYTSSERTQLVEAFALLERLFDDDRPPRS